MTHSVNQRAIIFSAVFTALFIFSAIVVAQEEGVFVDGESVSKVDVHGVHIFNNKGDDLNMVDVFENSKYTQESGTTSEVNLNTRGGAQNNAGAVVGTANMLGGSGTFYNRGGEVGTANVTNGTFWNREGNVGTANHNGGTFLNNDGSTVETANVRGGTFNNQSGSAVETANVYRGNFNNRDLGIVEQLNLSGGRVTNSSWINQLDFTTGYYNKEGAAGIGIGTLHVGGNTKGADYHGKVQDIDWSFVNNLQFDSSGQGVLRLGGYEKSGAIDFTNIHVMDHADMSYGGLSMNVSNVYMGESFDTFEDWTTTLLTYYGDQASYTFTWNALLGIDTVDNWDSLSYVELIWGNGKIATLFSGSEWLAGWGVSAAGIGIAVNSNAVVPEPATLAMVGLGLAGLGLARRRRKR